MCAGNFVNQEVAFKGQIVDSVNLILRNNLSMYDVCEHTSQ